MSTRCNIGIYNSKEDADKGNFTAMLYRHSDGYPEGVLPDILPFLKQWNRLDDGEYMAARLLQYLCNQYDEQTRKLVIEMGGKPSGDLTGQYGYGICRNRQGDDGYFYKIYPNAVEVYTVLDELQETISIDSMWKDEEDEAERGLVGDDKPDE